MEDDDPRAVLAAAAARRGLSLARLSAALRRNPAYLQQFVTRGTPRRLAEDDRRALAAMLDVPERALGGPPAPEPFRLPRLDVRASAGPGAFDERDEVEGLEEVDPKLARTLRLRPGQAGVIAVQGESMEPQLNHGDRLIVDTADRAPGSAGKLYVVRIDGALMVKRVRLERGRLRATSDNPVAPPVPDGVVEVVGRVVWRMGAPR